jgi:hypothetical protein
MAREERFLLKRFAVSGVTRDKEYDLTQGKDGSQVLVVYCQSKRRGRRF